MRETLRLWWQISVRNWVVYKKDFLANVSPTIADPALIMISLGFGLGGFLTNVEGRSYLQFLAPGLTVATALFTSFFESSYGFYVRMTFENVFKAMLTTPIGVDEIVWGELLWVGLKGALMALGVGIVLAAFGMMTNVFYLPVIAWVGFWVAIPCGAMGLLACAYVSNINQFQTVYSFVIAPLYFLSGIFFPLSGMPEPLYYVMSLFPIIHGVEIAQSLFWEQNVASTFALHSAILIAQSLVFSFWALRQIRPKL